MFQKFYVTTPIYYANGLPHIGHFLTSTIADSMARYYRLTLGSENVFFTTGLDEHGTTVEQSAQKEGFKNFQDYVDTKAVQWKEAFDETNIRYDYFVRTTNPKHKEFAQNLIQKMVEKGDVYKGTHVGKYCNGCEKFLTLSDLNEEGLCPLHRPDQVVEIKEDNYFFKLSVYAPKVRELILNDTIKILPEGKKTEMLSRLEGDIEDLSISRPKEKVSWAIEFPNDPSQTVYVWVEALINYLSSLEINDKKEFWDSSVHMLAKDINWFHTVIWPAFLLSAEIPLFKQAFVHSFLKVGGQKISKSLGNVITPKELVNKYGIDGARYLILANLPYKDDADVSWDILDEKYNGELANGLGNAVARVAKLAERSNFDFDLPDFSYIYNSDWDEPIKEFRTDKVLQNIWSEITDLDKHITENEPWSIKDEKVLKEVLTIEVNKIRSIGLKIKPFLPGTSDKINEAFGATRIKAVPPLFPRI